MPLGANHQHLDLSALNIKHHSPQWKPYYVYLCRSHKVLLRWIPSNRTIFASCLKLIKQLDYITSFLTPKLFNFTTCPKQVAWTMLDWRHEYPNISYHFTIKCYHFSSLEAQYIGDQRALRRKWRPPSLSCCMHGVAISQVRKKCQGGNLTAVSAREQGVPSSSLYSWMQL